jgi:hypothetical protein
VLCEWFDVLVNPSSKSGAQSEIIYVIAPIIVRLYKDCKYCSSGDFDIVTQQHRSRDSSGSILSD